jgi:hypothetical protein
VRFGAVASKGLFGQIPPVGMVFLRLITSSLILLAFVRPRLFGRPVTDWWPVLALGFAVDRPRGVRGHRPHPTRRPVRRTRTLTGPVA